MTHVNIAGATGWDSPRTRLAPPSGPAASRTCASGVTAACAAFVVASAVVAVAGAASNRSDPCRVESAEEGRRRHCPSNPSLAIASWRALEEPVAGAACVGASCAWGDRNHHHHLATLHQDATPWGGGP